MSFGSVAPIMPTTDPICDWFPFNLLDSCKPREASIPGTTPAYVPRTQVEMVYGPSVNPDPAGAYNDYWMAEYAAQADREIHRAELARASAGSVPATPKAEGCGMFTSRNPETGYCEFDPTRPGSMLLIFGAVAYLVAWKGKR